MRLLAEETAALVIDIQERLVPVIHDHEAIIQRTATLIQGCKLLEIPIAVARQYPKGLGDTVEEIRAALGEHTPFDKRSFSVFDSPEFRAHLELLKVKNIVLCGIESHVCVLQSLVDLSALGYRTALACDCVGSRDPGEKKTALCRAQSEGALLTTCESVLFELARTSEHPRFKEISALVK